MAVDLGRGFMQWTRESRARRESRASRGRATTPARVTLGFVAFVACAACVACAGTRQSAASRGGVDNADTLVEDKACAPLPDTFVYQPRRRSAMDTDEVTLAPVATLRMTRSRERASGSSVPMPCEVQLPCGKGNAYTVDDVANVLANGDVRAAFAENGAVLGAPGDGAFTLSQGVGGPSIKVGAPCLGQSGCRAIPPGVAAAVETLTRVYEYALRQPACAVLDK
jgi:hypothetical protein